MNLTADIFDMIQADCSHFVISVHTPPRLFYKIVKWNKSSTRSYDLMCVNVACINYKGASIKTYRFDSSFFCVEKVGFLLTTFSGTSTEPT